MNSKKAIPFIILMFITISCFGQKLTKYTGRFENGLQQAGTSTYYYYKEPGKDKKIKKGYFKYSLKQTKENSVFSQYITGSYEKNLKNKEWVYKINFKDSEIPKIKGKATGQMILTANYVNGVPHGKWTYQYNMKTRDIASEENGRVKWTKYSSPVIKELSIVWHNGMLVDTLYLNINNDVIINGHLDYYGFYHEDWVYYKKDKEETTKYHHGRIQTKKIYDINSGKEAQVFSGDAKTESRFQKIMSVKVSPTEKLEDLPYTLDTVSFLDNPNNIITSFINKNIYQNKYLLFDYIPGDLYNFNKLTGGYELKVIIQATAEQKEKIKKIEALRTNMLYTRNQGNNFKLTKKDFTDDDLNLYRTIEIFYKISEKYLCLAKNLVLYENVKTGMEKAEVRCEGEIDLLKENIPDFNSKNEALDFFILDLKSKYESAKRNLDLIND